MKNILLIVVYKVLIRPAAGNSDIGTYVVVFMC